MPDPLFRLRINFQKHDRLSLLSHLELVRAMERIIRRAQLPYAVSQGFNAHMRHAPGPALPVGTSGLNEFFDVWTTEYVTPKEVLARLRAASVVGVRMLGVKYVPANLRGLQATHVHEEYEMVLSIAGGVDETMAAKINTLLNDLIATGELKVVRKKKAKIYDLKSAVETAPNVSLVHGATNGESNIMIKLNLRSSDQGSVKPELLVMEALGNESPLMIKSITRTNLYSDED